MKVLIYNNKETYKRLVETGLNCEYVSKLMGRIYEVYDLDKFVKKRLFGPQSIVIIDFLGYKCWIPAECYILDYDLIMQSKFDANDPFDAISYNEN